MAAQVSSSVVHSEFRTAGLSLRGDTMRLVCDFLQGQSNAQEALAQLLVSLQARNLSSSVVSPDDVQAAISSVAAPASQGGSVAAPGAGEAGLDAGRQPSGHTSGVVTLAGGFTFVDAFAAFRYAYDPVRRMFHRASGAPSVLADADAKASLYRERFHLLSQRLARNPMFGKPALKGVVTPGAHAVYELTPLQALLGTTGEKRFVLGALSQLEDGRFWLEDTTGACAVDVSQAATSAGLFTENCVVVAEGSLRRDGVFEAQALGFPPVEPRGDSIQALGPHVDMFGAGTLRPEDVLRLQEAEEACSEEMWVILGDIYMDRPLVVAALRRVLGTFDAMEPPPALFVFMGDFCSHPAGASASGLDASKAAFESLGEVLREFNTLLEHSAFAFVPGPGDPSLSPTLPRPGLPLSLTRALRAAAPKAVLCSSPSRLRWHATDVVLFREDLAARMRRACVLPPVEDPPGNGDAMDEGTAEENVHESPEATAAKAAHARGCSLFSSLCATVLQQSHLVPLPLVHAPCLWQYDHSLWLFPQPQVLIMADRTAPQTSCEFEGCTCINPGAFGADGSFVVFKPATREVQLSGLPLSDTVS